MFARSLGIELADDAAREGPLHGLPPAFCAERFMVDGVSCYVAGKGPPLLLVHSVNAAVSAAEMRPIFERYTATHTVFALDLPAYVFSERSDRRYTPRVMVVALHAVCKAHPVAVWQCPHRRGGAVAGLRVSGSRGGGAANPMGSSGTGQPHRAGWPHCTPRPARGHVLHPRDARAAECAVVGRSAVWRADAPSGHPIFSAAQLGLQGDKRNGVGLRRQNRSPTRCQICPFPLPGGWAFQHGHSIHLCQPEAAGVAQPWNPRRFHRLPECLKV